MNSIITGSLAATSDFNMIQYLLQTDPTVKVLFIGDTAGYNNVADNFIVASILMPEYDIMEYDINNLMQDFQYHYFNYLNTTLCQQMISTILLALHMGKHLIFFFPPEAEGLRYPEVLLQYFQNVFGIVSSNGYNIPYAFNPIFTPIIACALYSQNFISVAEYIYYDAKGLSMINKVAYDLGFSSYDLEKLLAYCNDWANNMEQSNRILNKPFTLGGNIC